MTKIMTKVLLVVMVVNAVLSNFTFGVFAASKANSRVDNEKFSWYKENTLDNELNMTTGKLDEILLEWDMKQGGKYKLEFPIADGEEILFEVNKNNNETEVSYKVNMINSVNAKNPLKIYKTNVGYVEANSSILNSNIDFKNKYSKGNPKFVDFILKSKGAGVAFQYKGYEVKFKWTEDDKMRFVTNKATLGNIYPFKLTTPDNNNITKNIFLGISGTKITPFANANGNTEGKDLVEQVQRPITEYPGDDELGMKIEFDSPKEWNNANNKKFQHITNGNIANKQTSVRFDFVFEDKGFKLFIPNIYSNQNGNDITIDDTITKDIHKIKVVSYTYDTTTGKCKLVLKNNKSGTDDKLKPFESSIIYDKVFVEAERKNGENFEFKNVVLPLGSAYTHLKYKVIAKGPSSFYIEIQPFKNRNGFYTVFDGTSKDNLNKAFTYEERNDGENTISIPIDLNIANANDKYFRIDFTFYPPDNDKKQITLKSQVLHYKAFEQDIRIGVPKNLEILNSSIIKDDNGKENLFLTLKWDIASKETLDYLLKNYGYNNDNDKLKITYDFYKGEKPDGIDTKNGFIGVDLTFNDKNDLTKITGALTTAYNGKVDLINAKTLINPRNSIVSAEAKFKIPVEDKNNNTNQTGAILFYPNTYFIATEGTYKITLKDVNPTKEETFKTGVSLSTNLTLDGVEMIAVPEPQNLKVLKETIDKHNFSIQYDTLKFETEGDLLYKYNEIMLKTIDRMLTKDSISYDFYITQDKNLFDELLKLKKDEQIPESIKSKIKDLNITETMGIDGLDVDFKKNDIINTLRTKGIVKISDIKQDITLPNQKINFKGLDENETYYVIGKTIVTPYKLTDGVNKPLENSKDSSTFSNIVTATTINPQNPSENEKVPSAPTKFVAEDITLNSVDLVWDRVKDNLPPLEDGSTPKSTLEYQFIKTRGEQLPDAFLKSKDSYEKTWQGQYLKDVKNKYGLKTDKDELYEFDGEKVQFSNTVADKERYEYINWEGTEGRIKDKTLSTNQIYFYYIRTVRIDEKNNEVYSVWVPLTFTTKNTTGPTNLRVEPKADYNKKSEVVISFDIPKMDPSLIGTEYDLQYSIKSDLGEWSQDKTMPKDKLSFKENDDGKTMKVLYKITGLKSGTMYTIRVRMLNKPLDAPSMYSNEVEHRTDADNTENDYDQDVENWENHFKDLIEELKNQPYWFSKDTSSNTVVYYRPQYFDKIMATTNNSIIELVSGKGGSYKEYYLPASAVISAFDNNKGFKISYNEADVIFSAKTINPYDNDVIKKVAEELSSKSGNIKDYFIKLSVDFKNNKYIIDGSDSLGPSALITLSVVGTKDTIATLDQNMIDYIDKLLKIKEFSKDVKDKIKELIKNKTDNKIMVQEIGKMVDSFKSKFGDELGKDLNSLLRKTSHIQYLTGDIIFVYTLPVDISIAGYKKSQGNWISADVKDYLGKKAIYTKETGEYIFAGKKLVINGAGNLPNGNEMTSIVVKYGLDDFLGKDGNINLRAPITRRAAIGSLARIAGANKTQDPTEFFKTKGIVLSTRNMDNNITSEEAVHITMKVYEMRSGKKLETIKIRNYNLTSNIKNINKNYKKSIQVAFEIGIYNNQNMVAKGTITVQEFLQSLVNMSTMLGI